MVRACDQVSVRPDASRMAATSAAMTSPFSVHQAKVAIHSVRCRITAEDSAGGLPAAMAYHDVRPRRSYVHPCELASRDGSRQSCDALIRARYRVALPKTKPLSLGPGRGQGRGFELWRST